MANAGGAGGAMDLEFAINLPPGVSEEELAARLRSQVSLLNQRLAQPVLDVAVGGAPSHPAGPGTFPDRSGARAQWGADADSPPDWPPPRPGGPPGGGRGAGPPAPPANANDRAAHMDLLNHPTSPIGPGFLRDGSYWAQRQGSRIMERKKAEDAERREREQSSPAPFRARPVPPSVTAPLYQGIQASQRLKRSRSAEPPGRRRGMATGANQDEGQDQQRDHENRESSDERRPTSRERGAPREQAELRGSYEERPPPFRARPVPWCVSAPLYDQMLIENRRGRHERSHARSRAQMRSSSLPPRLEGVRRRLCGDGDDPHDGGGVGLRSSTPVPARQVAKGQPPESRVLNRPLKAELPQGLPRRSGSAPGVYATIDAAENLARDVASGPTQQAGAGWGMSNVHGSSYGISHITRHKTPPRTRGQSADKAPSRPFGTTEVPDFAALHEKQRRERQKYSNREATQPEPFVFTVPSRSMRARQAPLPKDPANDPRFHRRPRSARARSASGPRPNAAAVFAAGAEGGSPSMMNLQRPPVTGPPRTTAKTLQAQQHVASQLMEKRQQRQQKEQHVEQTKKVNPEIRARVMRAVGPVESIDDMVDRKVTDLRQNQRNTVKMKHKDLQDIANRVQRRPLLMEQTDSIARARRLALFQFRGFLKDAGVANPDAHFQDDELDELDRARADAAAGGC